MGQRRSVASLPTFCFRPRTNKDSHCEANLENALPSEQIKAADYSPAGDLKARIPATLQARHTIRQ